MINTIIFDLGGVLIDWNPRYVYKDIFDTEEEMDYFFQNICTHEWNIEQDAGRSLQFATEILVAKHPEYENEIRAFYGRWQEMLGGPIHENVETLAQIKTQNNRSLYALTNWSAETFPVALELFDFLHWFHGIVVSGQEKTRKPFPEIYRILLDRYSIEAPTAVFIDDNEENVQAAESFGMKGIHYLSPDQLKSELRQLGVHLE
jgi:2-haloacid dehalogenase